MVLGTLNGVLLGKRVGSVGLYGRGVYSMWCTVAGVMHSSLFLQAILASCQLVYTILCSRKLCVIVLSIYRQHTSKKNRYMLKGTFSVHHALSTMSGIASHSSLCRNCYIVLHME